MSPKSLYVAVRLYCFDAVRNGRRCTENVPINFSAVPIPIYVSTLQAIAVAVGVTETLARMHYCGARKMAASPGGKDLRVVPSYSRACSSAGARTHPCTVIAHCSSCQGRKCGVSATPSIDFQQYFESFAAAIRVADRGVEIHGSPMRMRRDRGTAGANFGRCHDNSAWANPVTDVRRACHDY
jgi:hypothetical protein